MATTQMAPAARQRLLPPETGRAGFGDALRSEFTKIKAVVIGVSPETILLQAVGKKRAQKRFSRAPPSPSRHRWRAEAEKSTRPRTTW